MVKVGKKIVKYRVVILILSVLLLIPSAMGYFGTRINYDVLTYLPENIETMKGQDIMVNDFGTGAFSMLIVDGMEDKDVAKLKEKVEDVDHVTKVLWYDSVSDILFKQAKHAQNILTEQLARQMQEAGKEDILIMSAGPYKNCSCMSAYSVDAQKMADAVGMVCWADDSDVRFFTQILFHKD